MKQKLQKFWRHKEWQEFSNKVKKRDDFQCLQCERTESQVILQVHHEVYRPDKKPWEYALSDCRTLCKGCHSKHHNLIEPSNGWYLIGVNDLGALDGVCERKNCGTEIRYEHITYHPNWGYKIVGSTCIDHLTQQDKLLSSDILKMYKQISKFVSKSSWEVDYTKQHKRFIETKYKYHHIRIYGDEKNYSFQLIIKEIGVKWYEYKKPIPLYNKGLEEIKELAYIALKGTISEDTKEVNLLRNIYRNIK